jgi:hypothetical protein
MKIPGLDHASTIGSNSKRVCVLFNGRVLADTTRALTLREAGLPLVQYVPREESGGCVPPRSPHRRRHGRAGADAAGGGE